MREEKAKKLLEDVRDVQRLVVKLIEELAALAYPRGACLCDGKTVLVCRSCATKPKSKAR